MHPAVAVARELSARGLKALVVANPYFRSVVEDAGLELVPVGTAADYENIAANPELWHPQRGFFALVRHVIAPAVRPTYEVIARYDPQNTLVVASGLLFGARIAHEKLGTGYVTMHLQPALFRSAHDTPPIGGISFPKWTPPWLKRLYFRLLDWLVIDRALGPPVNAVRGDLGLPPQRHFFGDSYHAPQLSLGLFPPWFAPPQPDWPPQVQLTGFVEYDRGLETSLPADVADFLAEGRAPLVFTAGTAMRHGQDFFATSVRAAQIMGRRAILISGDAGQIPDDLPPGVVHFRYVPFSLLLPHAAAIVHHGGIGTLAQALAAGLPQLVRPMSHDQPDNARRLQRLGVAETLPPRRYTARRVAQRLERLTTSAQVQARCGELAQRVDFQAGLAQTCAAIQRALEAGIDG